MIRSISFNEKYEPQNYTPDVYLEDDNGCNQSKEGEDLNSLMDQFTERFKYYEKFIKKLLRENDTIYDKCIDL